MNPYTNYRMVQDPKHPKQSLILADHSVTGQTYLVDRMIHARIDRVLHRQAYLNASGEPDVYEA